MLRLGKNHTQNGVTLKPSYLQKCFNDLFWPFRDYGFFGNIFKVTEFDLDLEKCKNSFFQLFLASWLFLMFQHGGFFGTIFKVTEFDLDLEKWKMSFFNFAIHFILLYVFWPMLLIFKTIFKVIEVKLDLEPWP